MVDLVNINSFDFYREPCETCVSDKRQCLNCLCYLSTQIFNEHLEKCEFLSNLEFSTVCDDCGRIITSGEEHNCLDVVSKRIETPFSETADMLAQCQICKMKYSESIITDHERECQSLFELKNQTMNTEKDLFIKAPQNWNLLNCERYSENLSFRQLEQESREFLEINDFFKDSNKFKLQRLFLIQNKRKYVLFQELKKNMPNSKVLKVFNTNKYSNLKKSLDSGLVPNETGTYKFTFRENLHKIALNPLKIGSFYTIYCELLVVNSARCKSVNDGWRTTNNTVDTFIYKKHGAEYYNAKNEYYIYPLYLVEFCIK